MGPVSYQSGLAAQWAGRQMCWSVSVACSSVSLSGLGVGAARGHLGIPWGCAAASGRLQYRRACRTFSLPLPSLPNSSSPPPCPPLPFRRTATPACATSAACSRLPCSARLGATTCRPRTEACSPTQVRFVLLRPPVACYTCCCLLPLLPPPLRACRPAAHARPL